MNVLNDFHCPTCDSLFVDEYRDIEVREIDCHNCSGTAGKVRAIPRFVLPGNDPKGFPTAHDAWQKKRREKLKEELKYEDS
jgi:hypothetical protein